MNAMHNRVALLNEQLSTSTSPLNEEMVNFITVVIGGYMQGNAIFKFVEKWNRIETNVGSVNWFWFIM